MHLTMFSITESRYQNKHILKGIFNEKANRWCSIHIISNHLTNKVSTTEYPTVLTPS